MLRSVFLSGLVMFGSFTALGAEIQVRGTVPTESIVTVTGVLESNNPLCNEICVGGPIFCGGRPGGVYPRVTSVREVVNTAKTSDGSFSFSTNLTYDHGFCAFSLARIQIDNSQGTGPHKYDAHIFLDILKWGETGASSDRFDFEIPAGGYLVGQGSVDISATDSIEINVTCPRDTQGECSFTK